MRVFAFVAAISASEINYTPPSKDSFAESAETGKDCAADLFKEMG